MTALAASGGPARTIPAAARREEPIPDASQARVARWFAVEAPVLLTGVFGFPARASRLRAGRIAREHWWTRAFLAGIEGVSPVRPIPQFSAPLSESGRPVGTVSVRLAADGSLLLCHVDRDASLAAELAARPAEARYVTDLINGSFLVIGDSVRHVSGPTRQPVSLRDAQVALRGQQSELRRAARDLDGAPAGCPDAIELAAG